MKNWISGRAAAKRLGVSHATVARWVISGKLLPFGYVDGVTAVFDVDSIEVYAEQLRKDPPRRGRPPARPPTQDDKAAS